MARPLRIEYEGALYHITTRGNGGEPIFLNVSDRETFLDILFSVVKRYNWLCHVYCLMDNHYHLIIETPEANLSSGMRQLNGVYTQLFNRRHNRFGHIFQGRFKAILVDKDSYLLELCRYVVLNPVRAHIVERPQEWRWSSFLDTWKGRKDNSFLTVDWILSQFDERKKVARNKYKAFVMEGIGKGSPWEKLKGQVILGGSNFVKRHLSLLREKEKLSEIPKIQRYLTRPGLEKIFRSFQKWNREKRDMVIYDAHVTYGYAFKEIADYLGTHYTTVSKAIRKVEDKKRYFKA